MNIEHIATERYDWMRKSDGLHRREWDAFSRL